MYYQCTFKAIISNVDETVIGNLDIGNHYTIVKDYLFKLTEDFDYTDFGIRRVYESDKISNKMEVALLYKKINFEAANIDEVNKESISIVHKEIEYIDEKMRTIRLYSNNSFNIKNLVYIIDAGEYHLRGRVPFPDRINNPVKMHLENVNEVNRINMFLKEYDITYEKSIFEKDKLIKAGVLYDSTYTSNYPIICFMCGVVALESLLGDENSKSEISYRLSRNCGILLANNENDYFQVKKDIKKIYKLRSDFVHCGIVDKVSNDDVILVRDYLRKVIFKIIELNISKGDLLKKLEISGFELKTK